MTKKWHKGPPPSIGWWPIKYSAYCWWDGGLWSEACFEGNTLDMVERYSSKALPHRVQKVVEWTERPASWPERSRT